MTYRRWGRREAGRSTGFSEILSLDARFRTPASVRPSLRMMLRVLARCLANLRSFASSAALHRFPLLRVAFGMMVPPFASMLSAPTDIAGQR